MVKQHCSEIVDVSRLLPERTYYPDWAALVSACNVAGIEGKIQLNSGVRIREVADIWQTPRHGAARK